MLNKFFFYLFKFTRILFTYFLNHFKKIFPKMLRTWRVLYLRVLVNKFYNIYFAISITFLLNFSKTFPCWYANQTMFFFLVFDDFVEFTNYCCRIFSIFNFPGFFLKPFFFMSFTINNRIFKFLLYFYLQLSCSTACFRDAVKVLYLKLKTKVEQVLK